MVEIQLIHVEFGGISWSLGLSSFPVLGILEEVLGKALSETDPI